MAQFTPDYNVSYRGSFHRGGDTFEIKDADAEEMKKHGKVHNKREDARYENKAEEQNNNEEKAPSTKRTSSKKD